jgi:hypothetical protein
MVKIFATQRKGGSRGFGDDVEVGGWESMQDSGFLITRSPDYPIILAPPLTLFLCVSSF